MNNTYNKPIILYGVICLNITNQTIYDFFLSKYKFTDNIQQKNICINKYIQKNINNSNKKDLNLYENYILHQIKLITIKRKYTYYYIYLIRGTYELEIEIIIQLFNKLTITEYNNLISKSFDELWNDIYDYNIKIMNTILFNKYNHNMYTSYNKAKEQFNLLINYILPQINNRLNITCDNIEWDFPTGEIYDNKSIIDCAIKYFNEYTELNTDNYVLLDRLLPFIITIKDINNIYFKYIYYIALLKYNYLDNKNYSFTQIIKHNKKYILNDKFNLYTLNDIIYTDYNKKYCDIINNLKLFLIYNIRYIYKYYHNK